MINLVVTFFYCQGGTPKPLSHQEKPPEHHFHLRCRDREDFVQLVMEHGEHLPGKAGNYRIAKFPGTERILFKTNFSKAFKDKTWYPKTFILPEEKAGSFFS